MKKWNQIALNVVESHTYDRESKSIIDTKWTQGFHSGRKSSNGQIRDSRSSWCTGNSERIPLGHAFDPENCKLRVPLATRKNTPALGGRRNQDLSDPIPLFD